MKVLVLGAGVVGTTSAWYLQQAGHEVTVIDRQPAAALETSFANGGQISVSHAEPWSNLRILPKALRWLGKEDAPLLFRLRADPALIRWSLRFLVQCWPSHTRANIGAIVRLALYSRTRLQALRQELGLEYDQLGRGILHIYSDAEEFAGAIEAAELMRSFGLDREPVGVARCVEIEPALAACSSQLVGGDYTPSDESGDAHRFTQALAARAAESGVCFRYGTRIERIAEAGGKVAGIVVAGDASRELVTADAYVVALGSYSPLLLKPLGLRPAIYPAKGYSATVALTPESVAPSVSLTDDEKKIVFSRLGNRLRIAGTAEFNGYSLDLNPVRCAALMRRAQALFPDLRPAAAPDYWCGLRPATPSNLPYLGRTPYPNLWLNTGHGTLGWTMACGSAAVLADQISGRSPDILVPRQG
ncbi:MAG TPA: D-amino acid dehydrogenase, partial [Rhodocyclaceae bacterium]|nr:D-amino acid dehydrogenase [Rhodocyclaceae bacterium]